MIEFIVSVALILFLFAFFLWLLLELFIRFNEQLPRMGATLIELWAAFHAAQATIIEARVRRWRE